MMAEEIEELERKSREERFKRLDAVRNWNSIDDCKSEHPRSEERKTCARPPSGENFNYVLLTARATYKVQLPPDSPRVNTSLQFIPVGFKWLLPWFIKKRKPPFGFEQSRHLSVNYLPAGNILRVFKSRPDESRRVNIRPSTRLELFKFIQSQVSSLNL